MSIRVAELEARLRQIRDYVEDHRDDPETPVQAMIADLDVLLDENVIIDEDAPCCYGNVTSGGQFHEPGCPDATR